MCVGVGSAPHGKIVRSCENVNAMRESPLSPHVLLEGSGGSSATVDLSIKHSRDNKSTGVCGCRGNKERKKEVILVGNKGKEWS